jgi:hypothetical protein
VCERERERIIGRERRGERESEREMGTSQKVRWNWPAVTSESEKGFSLRVEVFPLQ